MIHHDRSHLLCPPAPGANMRFLPWIGSRQRAEEQQQQQKEQEVEIAEEEEGIMVGSGYMFSSDEAYDGLFDKIEDLLDFTEEEMHILSDPEPLLPCQDGSLSQLHPEGFSLLSPPPPPPPPAAADAMAAGLIGGFNGDDGAFHCDDFDAAELEWLSNFVEDSFSPTPASMDLIGNDSTFQMIDISNTVINRGIIKEDEEVLQYRTPSPVSVLENSGITGPGGPTGSGGSASASFSTFSASWSSSSSSSSPTSSSSCSSVGSGMNNMVMPFSNPPEAAGVVREKRKRTQRSRPAALPRGHIVVPPFVVAPPTSCENAAPFKSEAEFSTYWESNGSLQQAKILKQQQQKKKTKVSPPIFANAEGQEAGGSSETPAAPFVSALQVRKCMHCEIQKTPQWRAGPMGPKTLCNACGVRYKSGRLFPEYRPAASPTFVSSVHSNSHKKVVEMRINATQKDPAAVAPLPVSAKACELLNYIRGATEIDA